MDLATVQGTGPAGRITREDVERAAAARSAPAAAPAAAAAPAPAQPSPPAHLLAPRPVPGEERVERIPFRGVRKAVAQQMVRSKFTAPHFSFAEECDMTEVVKLRSAEKERLKALGIKLTYLPFVIRAVCEGLKAYPIINSRLDEEAGEIELRHYYHIGISIDAPQGLSVGVIRHADQRSLAELALELERLVTAVRSGKAKREDLTGSTFTITSAGNIGGLFATPIINYPEVAILGVNAIRKRPVVVEGPDGDRIEVRHHMILSGSFDHRVVDGAVAARFTREVVRYLEQPARLLIGA
ncbi:MAG: 2-oxo acid dehydrogenase subunit E2 [Planctomycetota bacterium]|nr:MAG: 2-oxo acid dehydrogenase subunit E2 [Planctomycetota bacterium]